jgi:hypothetical protein
MSPQVKWPPYFAAFSLAVFGRIIGAACHRTGSRFKVPGLRLSSAISDKHGEEWGGAQKFGLNDWLSVMGIRHGSGGASSTRHRGLAAGQYCAFAHDFAKNN